MPQLSHDVSRVEREEVTQEAWNDFGKRLSGLSETACAALMRRAGGEDSDWDLKWAAIQRAALDKLEEKYDAGMLGKYVAYHVLTSGSGESRAKNPFLDFPGDLSVEKLFRDIIEDPQRAMLRVSRPLFRPEIRA